jgi:hypothetical protein
MEKDEGGKVRQRKCCTSRHWGRSATGVFMQHKTSLLRMVVLCYMKRLCAGERTEGSYRTQLIFPTHIPFSFFRTITIQEGESAVFC